ncbi:MAG TPA: ATP-binding cassette domain-containing protein [Terrimicrobiaceae bacterium]
MNPVLTCRDLCCHRTNWNESQTASIQDVTLTFSSATLCEFDGPDSSGRDLLLSNLGLLEPADSGTICLDGRNIGEVPEDDLRRLRNETFGFLFQYPCLLPSFSVAENVAMPLFRICGTDAAAARERTFEVLDFCGIPHLEKQLAGRLAASAQRRTALARALVHRPKILVAITPRGGDELFDLALRTARELGLCVLWAGQDGKAGEKAQRVIQVRDGRISSDRQL